MEENKEKKTINISMGGFIFLIISFILLIMVSGAGIGIYVYKNINNNNSNTPNEQNELKEIIDTNNQISENDTNSNTEKNEIIKPVNHITIEILDEQGQGLEYTEPKTIRKEEIIEELRNYLNDSEQYDNEKNTEENRVWLDFEGAPIITLYFKDGKYMKVVGETFSEDIGTVFYTVELEDYSDKTFYKPNSKDIDFKEYIEGIYKDSV